MNKRYFITGIGTGIGKTVVSAVLTEALQADYWKPVQSGIEDQRDHDFVKAMVSNKISSFFPEKYLLKTPVSPHLAADIDGISLNSADFTPPETSNTLIIEGAGGLLVPISKTETIADLIRHLNAEIILVSQNYLGAINHTLLTLEAIRSRNLPLAGIIFNGEPFGDNEEIISELSQVNVLGTVPTLSELTPESIANAAKRLIEHGKFHI